MRFVLSGNCPPVERGCEAIEVGTLEILQRFFDPISLVCVDFDHAPAIGTERVVDERISYRPLVMYRAGSLRRRLFQLEKLLLTRPIAYWRFGGRAADELAAADVVLSSGGDSYFGRPFMQTAIDRRAIKIGKPLVLWGASINPIAGSRRYRKSIFRHLSKFTAIFVRESMSVQRLGENGVTENVFEFPDPSFAMSPRRPSGAPGIPEGAVGLNISPLYLRRTPRQGNPKGAVAELVEGLRREFGRPVLLVPHCNFRTDNDYVLLSGVLRDNAGGWPDVTCLPDTLSAPELKWVISKLHVLVAARAHAAIAGASSRIPTVVLTYNAKGVGVAMQTAGTLEYTVAADAWSPQATVDKTALLLRDHVQMVNHLNRTIPQIEQWSISAGQKLREILDSRAQ